MTAADASGPPARLGTADAPSGSRRDLQVIVDLVKPGGRILDVGCEDGSLMALLEAAGSRRVQGIEISQAGVNRAVARGLSVLQGDADTDLDDYPPDAFDYVILSQTIQATRNPRRVLENLLRIGTRAIVSFPNFGFWKVRLQLLVQGRMPVTGHLPRPWYETENIHFCTIRDFVALTEEIDAKVETAIALDGAGRKIPLNAPWWFWNLFGEQAVFVLKR